MNKIYEVRMILTDHEESFYKITEYSYRETPKKVILTTTDKYKIETPVMKWRWKGLGNIVEKSFYHYERMEVCLTSYCEEKDIENIKFQMV